MTTLCIHVYTIFLIGWSTKLLTLLLTTTAIQAAWAQEDQQHKTKYGVLSLVPQPVSMAVVVDDKVYPLHQSNLTSLLYTGDAPAPSQGYYFAKTSDGQHVTEREPFTRNLDGRPGDDIYYEVYNRSVNAHPMKDMPQYLEPLESIHRIDSDLHRYNEIATVHFTTANQSAIDYMHTNVTADFQVVCNMTYIRLVVGNRKLHACMHE